MRHLVFPTYELHPFNPGGAGVFLAGGVRLLANAGYRVTLLADFAAGEIEAARRSFEREPHAPGSIEVASLPELVGHHTPHGSIFEFNSERFADGVERLGERGPIDLVEFPEYAGMGVVSLRRQRTGILRGTKVALRLHGSLQLIDEAEHLEATDERRKMWALEQEGLRLAEVLLSPSRSLGALYEKHYRLKTGRVRVSPPPMEELLLGFERVPRLPDPAHFLFYGKLQEVKGCVQFGEALAHLMAIDPEQGWCATFIGRDTFCARHGRMTSECLFAVVPPVFRAHLRFVPTIDRLDLGTFTRRPAAAVVPSHFETFCLAAHELRALGIPLIVPRHPAFVDWLNEDTGCLTFDGTSHGLAAAMRQVREQPELLERLERAPGPRYPRFVEAYDRLFRDEP